MTPNSPNTIRLSPWQIDYHILMFVDDDGVVTSGICCEVYCFSATALVAYLVTNPAYRQQGLAARLVHAMHQILNTCPSSSEVGFEYVSPCKTKEVLAL